MSNLRYNKMYFLEMFDGFLPPQEFSYFVTTEFCIRPPAKGASGQKWQNAPEGLLNKHDAQMDTSDVEPEMLDGLRFVCDELISPHG